MRTPQPFQLAHFHGTWQHDPAVGLTAHIWIDGHELAVGGEGQQLHTVGALAVEMHSDLDKETVTFDNVLTALAATWTPSTGAPTITTLDSVRRDAARHLVTEHQWTVLDSALHCHVWAEDIVDLPVRDRLADETGRWWITETGLLARTYGHSELSDLDVTAYRTENSTYALILQPAIDLPYIGKQVTMTQMVGWSPTTASTAEHILQLWGKDPDQVKTIDNNISHIS